MNNYYLYLSGLLSENELYGNVTKLPAGIRKKANDQLHGLGNYHKSIPLREMEAILKMFGIEMVNEDGTPFGAIFTGREGRTNIDLAMNGSPIANSQLILTWHKMEESGNWEIIAYLS